jgi:ATP-dependent DNA ligase
MRHTAEKIEHHIKMFHRSKSGIIKVWECWVIRSWVHSCWHMDGGVSSVTKEFVKPKNKWSEKQVNTAYLMWLKKIKKKKRKGYVVDTDSVIKSVEVDGTKMNFDLLSRAFTPAKPIKKVNVAQMTKWETENRLLIQRKRDGQRHYLVSNSKGELKIYSSGKEEKTEHLASLLVGLKLPPKTIMDCELVCTTPNDNDQAGFLIVSGIARSKPNRARAAIKRQQQDGNRIELLVFDLLWENGTPVFEYRYEDRYRRIAKVLEKGYGTSERPQFVRRMPLVSISPTRLATLREAIDMVSKKKWEGLVLWRKDESTMVQMNGTPARVNCWKLKPLKEEDVIAVDYKLGKGKNRNVVGTFNIGLAEDAGPAGWRVRPMGKCGGGLDDETRKKALSWTYPCVIQIEYDSMSEKGFRFPIFKRKRDDKKPSDCVVA